MTNLGQGVNWDNPNLNRPYSWEYSLHLQQQYGQWLFEIGYSHNKTYDIPVTWNGNEPSFDLWKQLQQPVFDSNGRPGDILPWNTLVPNPFYQLPNVTGSIASSKNIKVNQLLNPNPLLGSMDNNRPSGKNTYDALQDEDRAPLSQWPIAHQRIYLVEADGRYFLPWDADRRTQHRAQNSAAKTGRTFLRSPASGIFLRARQALGRRPSRPLNLLVGGWELTGNYSAASGVPVVFGTNSFYSGEKCCARQKAAHDSSVGSTPISLSRFPIATQTSQTTRNGRASSRLPGAGYQPAANDTIRNGVYQDFAAYIRNYPTRWGNIRQQGNSELVVGLYKNIAFNSTTRLQLRFDAFNALNHPRFGGPDTILATPASASLSCSRSTRRAPSSLEVSSTSQPFLQPSSQFPDDGWRNAKWLTFLLACRSVFTSPHLTAQENSHGQSHHT